MSLETKPSTAQPADVRQSRTTDPVVPIWLIVLLFVLLYWGALYFDKFGGWFSPEVYPPYKTYAELESYQPKTEGPDLARGKTVFDSICALCHGVNGEGKPGQAPPFAGSEWVLGPAEHMIRIPMYGLTGPVKVKGETYNLSMPAMGAALSPDDLSAVLSYIRSSFGNNASPITAEQVSAVKAKVGSRSQPFTADELMAIK